MKSLFKFSGLKNSPPIERTQIVEEDAALVSWYEETLDVFTHFSHRLWKDRWSTKIKPCLCVNIIRCSTVHLVQVRAEFVQCLILGLENSSWQWRRHITDLHREPFFIIFNRLSLSDVKFVSTKVSLVRLKDEKCETSPLRVVFRYHLLTLIVSGLTPAWSSVSVNLSGFITSSLKSISTLCLKKSQILIKVVSKAPSLCSRFRPTIDSAETSGSWRPHCHNTGRTGKWDTEKNGYFNNAHVQCNHLREWIDAWVCECADGIFVASWLPESMEVLTNITWDGPARGAGERKITLRRLGRKPFSPLCAWMFLHHVDKNALCYMRVLKVWMNVNFQ